MDRNRETSNNFAFVYILELENGAFYTGYTIDLDRRLAEHIHKKRGAKTTRSFRPIRLLMSWKTSDRSTALRLERAIKSLHRKEKESLIADPKRLRKMFPQFCGVRLYRRGHDL